MGRILGLDVGEKTIGIAVSDELHWTAQGVMTLKREGKKKDFPALLDIVEQYDVEEIVIGLPKNMDDTVGAQAEKTLKFSRMLAGRLPSIKMTLWDERLSTSTADRVLVEADVSRKKRKNVINTLAAVVILQACLDARSL